MIKKLEKEEAQMVIAEMLSSGATKSEVMTYIKDVVGVYPSHASEFYHNCIKKLVVDDDALADYKKTVQQQNYTRLERIVKETIDGNPGSKKVAIEAIKELNKMSGAYDDGNRVTIAQDDDKQVIQIDFNR